MAKKQTTEDVLAIINAPGFESSVPDDDDPTDIEILSGTVLNLPVDEVDFFDANPRTLPNPKYDDIRASIRAVGQKSVVVVSIDPETGRYVLVEGGNTRLRILRELYAETKDKRFAVIRAVYQRWGSDHRTGSLIAHLIENELHGSMSFIERATARLELKAEWEEEEGHPLTDAELVERLRTFGLPAERKRMNLMRYAVADLMPYLPNALRAGMGRPMVARLRQIERAVLSTLQRNEIDESDWINSGKWSDILAGVDEPGLEAETVILASENELVQFVELAINNPEGNLLWLLRDFQAYLTGTDADLPPPSWRTDEVIEPEDASTSGMMGGGNEPETTPTPVIPLGLGDEDGENDDPETASLFGYSDGTGTVNQAPPAAMTPTVPQSHSEPLSPPTATSGATEEHRAEIRALCDGLASMMGSAWREVGDIMVDRELDPETTHTIHQLFRAFEAYSTERSNY